MRLRKGQRSKVGRVAEVETSSDIVGVAEEMDEYLTMRWLGQGVAYCKP